MQSQFCHRVKILLGASLACFALSASAADADYFRFQKCSDLLTKAPLLTRPLRSLEESLPALTSRLKPVFTSSQFDVRILSRSILKNTFSPLQLKEKAISEISELQRSYQRLDFKFHAYLQVLVEAHPRAMGQLQLGPQFQFIWHNSSMETPWVGNAREMIGIPNILGFRSLFIGRREKMGFEDFPKFLVFPATTSTYHSLQDRFIVAHELAHVTENEHSHKDMMWREARADFLAFLTTGETDMVFPEGIKLEFVKSDGSIYEKTVTKARSMSEPAVASEAEIMPNLKSYHHNSQIISSALLELTQKLGRQKMIEFIHWMDNLSGQNTIPNLVPKSEDLKDIKASADVEYVDQKNLSAVKSSILSHLTQIGDLFREWARLHTKDDTQVIVETVLSRRRI